MNRDTIENEMEQLLANFSEQFTRTKNYKSIPKIEVDLMMTTLRNLYEELYKLNNFSSIPEKNVLAESKIFVAPSPVVEEKIIQEEVSIQTVISESEPIAVKEEIVVEESMQVETKTIQHQVQDEVQMSTSIKREAVFTEQTKVQSKVVASLFDDVPTLADNYKEQQSLHHKIGETKTERYSDKLQQQPVSDLKRSIGINEKFAFMNELFAGNQQQYNQSIETLNNFSDYKEAHSYLNTLASDMKWNTNSKTYNELIQLVKRRFGV